MYESEGVHNPTPTAEWLNPVSLSINQHDYCVALLWLIHKKLHIRAVPMWIFWWKAIHKNKSKSIRVNAQNAKTLKRPEVKNIRVERNALWRAGGIICFTITFSRTFEISVCCPHSFDLFHPYLRLPRIWTRLKGTNGTILRSNWINPSVMRRNILFCRDDFLQSRDQSYRSGTVNSKSFVGKVLLRIKWKFELN